MSRTATTRQGEETETETVQVAETEAVTRSEDLARGWEWRGRGRNEAEWGAVPCSPERGNSPTWEPGAQHRRGGQVPGERRDARGNGSRDGRSPDLLTGK